jgi:hypothetical protein
VAANLEIFAPKTKREVELWLASIDGVVRRFDIQAINYYNAVCEKLSPNSGVSAIKGAPLGKEYARWMRRIRDELPTVFRRQLNIIPFAIELTNGCSMGCWYCGVNAPKLRDIAPLSECSLRATLATCRDLFGEWGASGLLYWATDPLDHPEYEKAASIFQSIFGRRPFVSTVVGGREPARLRPHIDGLMRGDLASLRVTVNSKQDLLKIFSAFEPRETARVWFDIKTKRSPVPIMNVGRAKDVFAAVPSLRDREIMKRASYFGSKDNSLRDETIACVLGLLINLPNRTVRLIEPSVHDAGGLGFRTVRAAPLDPSHLKALFEGIE